MRITPRGFGRMCEYRALCDVHDALTGAQDATARDAARHRLMADLPDAYHTYLMAQMEVPPGEVQ